MSKVQQLYDTESRAKEDVDAKYIVLTSFSSHNYLGITAHVLDRERKLESFALTMLKTETRH